MPNHIRIPWGETLYRILWTGKDIHFTYSESTEQKNVTLLDESFVLPNVTVLPTNSYNESYLASIVTTSKKEKELFFY